MEKEGKFDLLSVVILSTLIFAVFAVLVFGDVRITTTFPENETNASAYYGYSPSAKNASFNGTNASFHCFVSTNESALNVTNVSLYISRNVTTFDSAILNQTQNTTVIGTTPVNIIFNFTTAFNEGTYWWFCRAEDNGTGTGIDKRYNTTVNRSFTIDYSGPGYTNLTNTSNADVATGNSVLISANFTDMFTTIHTVRLFVNHTGSANTEVNSTGVATNNVDAANSTMVNLSYVIPGRLLGGVLNFTLWANDSVNNYNITSAILIRVTQDGTPPGITLNKPIHLFNQSSPTVEFNFTAYDNNNSQFYNFTCGINISLATSTGPIAYANISNIQVTNGTDQKNSTLGNLPQQLSNGTYAWNVSCTDKAGNLNTSLSQNFTIDNIPPALLWINLTNSSYFNGASVASVINGTGSLRQEQVLYLTTNLTDNLTQPLNISLEWLNGSTWMVVNRTSVVPNAAKSSREYFWGNASFTIPTGRNEFEGRNVSFRVVYNDTLGNGNTSLTQIVQINDTYAPTLTINSTVGGVAVVNGTNTSNTRPLISWIVNENNQLTSINVSVDGVVAAGKGLDATCNKFAFYDTSSTATTVNVEKNRNNSFQILDDPACTLGNGTHFINITAIDIWGNSRKIGYTFNVQSGSKPGLAFNLTFEDAVGTWIKGNINGTNITSWVGVTLFGSNGAGASIDKIAYNSSCNTSSVVVVVNNTVVYPFNESSCDTLSGNRTLRVTINDTAGNSNTTVLGFLVDNVGPTITVHNPTPGFSTTGKIEVNVSAFDGESQIEWIKYYLDGGLTLLNHTQNGSVLTGSFGQNATKVNRTINFTAGTHTIKISVNDTLGNIRNSSWITFTYAGPFNFMAVNKSLRTAVLNYTNVSVFNSSGNLISDSSTTRSVDETLKIFMALNTSRANINVSINFNGSAANWDALNFTVGHNDSRYIAGIENNFTAKIVELITFNTSSDGFTDSIDDFLTDSNSYYGFIDLTLNATNMSAYGGNDVGGLGGKYKLWYFSNETALNSKVNITECTQNKVITHKTTTASDSNFPCWNNTLNRTVRVYVPHFSAVVLVNESRPPTVSITYPKNIQTESVFIANITVSNDAVLCNVSYVGASSKISNRTMTGPTAFGNEKICTYTLDNVTNGTAQNNNITFNVFDGNGNLNTTVFNFNVSDTTVHNLTSVSIGSITSTGATVTITANESVNMSVNSTGSNVLTASHYSNQSNFGKTNSITFSSLASSTAYNFTVQTCDKAGNCIFNNTLGFTTSAAEAAAAAAAAAAASTGGGGAVPVSNVADSKGQVWSTIPKGSSVTLNVDKETIAVTSVAVSEVKSELKNVDLTVQAFKSKPVSAAAAAKVYQYISITKKNIADTDAGAIKVGFRVTKAWLTENSMASADVVLYRYKDDKWNKLVTKVTGTDDKYVNYEAETPGLSYFAIGSKTAASAELQAILDMIDSFYATGSPTLIAILDAIDSYYSAGGG